MVARGVPRALRADTGWGRRLRAVLAAGMATATLAGDANLGNNAAPASVTVSYIAPVTGFPYFQDFESGAGGWTRRPSPLNSRPAPRCHGVRRAFWSCWRPRRPA